MIKIVTDANSGVVNRHSNSQGASAMKTLPSTRREFFNRRFVYCVISQRAGGLSIGINMNPDQYCNFACVYCEIDRSAKRHVPPHVDLEVMARELQQTLDLVKSRSMRALGYQGVPDELLELKEVALSGDGEPTLSPDFSRIVERVVQLRAAELFPFFKIVLITNCSGLHLPDVQAGLAAFTARDEVWAKLDAGTQGYMDLVNRSGVNLEFVSNNILDLARRRPVIIQSLFTQVDGLGPAEEEVEQFARRLRQLKEAGAQIPLVQIYSAHRPSMDSCVAHLPLKILSSIARRVREVSGLKTEVF